MTTKSHKTNPADKVEQWPIEKLVPYAKNSRTHSEEQVAQIAASIKEWGFTTAVLVDESGSIIAGHGRCRLDRCPEARLRHCRQQAGDERWMGQRTAGA